MLFKYNQRKHILNRTGPGMILLKIILTPITTIPNNCVFLQSTLPRSGGSPQPAT